ncbi:MAG TPA: DUF885 domain-containing protein [Gemmatimonadaceae bacterium]|jgi:uncharacterized protein (DUF885 family)|nr:DUF885 domain-containing protein [Gemmatimonadaceae bacterium]
MSVPRPRRAAWLLSSGLIAIALFSTPCAAQSAAATPARWDSLVTSLLDAYFAAQPRIAVGSGRHEFDGRLPDWSERGLAAFGTLLTDWRARAVAFDTTQLDATRKLERAYVIARMDRDLWWLRSADGPHRNPHYYGGALDPDPYLTRPYAPLETRMRSYIGYARSVVTAAEQIRANLRPPLARSLIDRGHGLFGGFAAFYTSDVPAVFAPVKNPALQRELAQANDSAAAAMRALDEWLLAQRATQTESFALGADKFREMLYAIERVDTPLDELERIGREDLRRNQAALEAACARYAPGATIHDCVRKEESHKPKENSVDAARRQLVGLRQFILDKGVATIPGTEQAKVGESPPYARYNFAYIVIPGPYEKHMPATYYVAPPDPAWTAEQRAGYIPGEANLLFTSVHEVWPGHFLQFLHANRSRSTFGRVFVGYAYAEGWAHYAEEMMWDEGLGNGDPEAHIGQLTNALLRNVRFLSAIGMHARGMTVAESERLFREEGYQAEATSKQQAARGTFDPEYLDYTMGKLMIRKLRDDWTATRGGTAAWKQFHDTFLSYGGPPIPLVREAMMHRAGKLF